MNKPPRQRQRTPAKARAARINGTLGGRPRLVPSPLVSLSATDGLARHLAIAFISYQGHVSFPTAMKNYGNAGPPSAYWMAIARQVYDDFIAGRFGPSVQER